MFASRTVIRVSAMAVLATGPTVAAVIAPSTSQQRPEPPARSAVLLAPGNAAPQVPGPVRMASAPAVARAAEASSADRLSQGTAPAVQAAPAASSPARQLIRPLSPADQQGASSSDWVVHRVRDGDSLEQLAAKYLGDPDRAEEILLWNCDRIDDPAMLPLGVELLIPASGF